MLAFLVLWDTGFNPCRAPHFFDSHAASVAREAILRYSFREPLFLEEFSLLNASSPALFLYPAASGVFREPELKHCHPRDAQRDHSKQAM